MQTRLHTLLFILITCSLSAQSVNKVLIIGIDGCRADALDYANTPNIDLLTANSVYSLDALNNDITSSGPGWSAMLTGVWSDKHGVTDNSFSGSNYDDYPHFFNRVENYDSNLHTASICQWGPVNDFIVNNEADFKMNVNSGEAVMNEAINYLSNEDPDALFLHFDDVDHAGHAYGFNIAINEYVEAIETVDTQVGSVIVALTQRPNYANENWLVTLSTDHGGIGFSHGGNTIDEENIFVIASNPLITPQQIIKDSTVTTIPPPVNCLNESIELNFDGLNDYVSVANDGIFDFGSDQDFSVECRVRTNVSGDVSIVGNKDWDSGLFKGFILSFKYPSGPEWKVNIGDGTDRADIDTGGEIADGQWHTLSVTFDRDGLMTMYEDGVQLESTDISFIGDIDTDFDLRFGADGEGGYPYNGAIAEVRIWNKVLDAGTINDWHCSPIELNHPDIGDLLGYWKVNDGIGATSVEDFSNNSNDGIINEAAWAEPDTTLITYNYDATPRITDVAVTALTHLCIPIDPAWQLDGQSLVADCMTSSLNKPEEPLLQLTLSPNPLKNVLNVELSPKPNSIVTLQIYDISGQLLLEQKTDELSTLVKLGDLSAGTYTLKVIGNERVYSRNFLKQ